MGGKPSSTAAVTPSWRRSPNPQIHYSFSHLSDDGSSSTLSDGIVKTEWHKVCDAALDPPVAKILVIGPPRVGASAVITQLLENNYRSTTNTVTDNDPHTKKIKIDGRDVILEIADSHDAGAKEDASIRLRCDHWLQTCDAYLLMFDITNKQSLKDARWKIGKITWRGRLGDLSVDASTNRQDKRCVAFVGNKSDLAAERQVTAEEAQAQVKDFNYKYFEISAKDNVGITEVFHSLALDAIFETKKSYLARDAFQAFQCEMPCATPERIKAIQCLTRDSGIHIGPPSEPSLPSLQIVSLPVIESECQALMAQASNKIKGSKTAPVVVIGIGRLFFSVLKEKVTFILPIDAIKHIMCYLGPNEKSSFTRVNKFLLLQNPQFSFGLEAPQDFELLDTTNKTLKNLLKAMNAKYFEAESLSVFLDVIQVCQPPVKKKK